LDSDRQHLTSVLRQAAAHKGTALVEIYQNCNIFNDGAFNLLVDADTREEFTIRMTHGQPLRFGAARTSDPDADGVGSKAIIRTAAGKLLIEEDVSVNDPRVVVHDAHDEDPSYAFALSRLTSRDTRYAPMGVFRSVVRPSYDAMMSAQLDRATASAPKDTDAMDTLLRGTDSWTIG
jgi:2-oxoglutarate/2-oxoacid ferredoxin oxidoreductase subunit beta